MSDDAIRPITVTVTPLGQRTDALDCSSCGVLDIQPHDAVDVFVYDHLMNVHNCDPNTVDIRNP